MKKAFWLLSLVGMTAVHANTATANSIMLSQGDRQVNMEYQAPAIDDAELDAAINRITANATPSQFNTRQYNDVSYDLPAVTKSGGFAISGANGSISGVAKQNQSQSLPQATSINLGSGAAPSVAAQVASRAAHSRSQGRCALYVRKALQAAGYKFTSQPSAYMYATNGTLKSAGFVQISSDNYQPQVGDVVVFNRTGKHPHGHIQIFDGGQWVSDFRQPKFSPYSQHGGYSVWRDAKHLDASGTNGTYLAMTE